MSVFRVASIVLAAGLVTACAQTGPVGPPAKWRLANEYPATSLPGEADTWFAKTVAERTGGRLVVEPVFDAKSGLRTREQVRAVASGAWEMADSFAGALADEHPLFLLSSLPFLTASAADAQRLHDRATAAYERLFAERNQRILYVSPWPASGLWSAVPLDAASLKTLKVRTYDATGTDLFRRVAASASVVSFADLPARLASRDVNAVLSSGDGGAGRRLWEHLPHFTEIQYATPVSFGTVNLAAWNRLDAATRRTVEAIGRETTARQWAAMQGRVEVNYKRMLENGMRIERAPSPAVMAALRAAAAEAEAAWLARAGDEGRAILAAYRGR